MSPRAASLMALANDMRAEKDARRTELKNSLEKYVGATGVLGATTGYLLGGPVGALAGGTLLSKPLYAHTKAAAETGLSYLWSGVKYVGRGIREGAKLAIAATSKGIDAYTSCQEYHQMLDNFYSKVNEGKEIDDPSRIIDPREARKAQATQAEQTLDGLRKKERRKFKREEDIFNKKIKKLNPYQIKLVRHSRNLLERAKYRLGIDTKPVANDINDYRNAAQAYAQTHPSPIGRLANGLADTKRMKKYEATAAQLKTAGITDANTLFAYSIQNGLINEAYDLFAKKQKQSAPKFGVQTDENGNIQLGLAPGAGIEDLAKYIQATQLLRTLNNDRQNEDPESLLIRILLARMHRPGAS